MAHARPDRYDRLELETMLLTRYLLPQRRFASTRHTLERSAYTLLSRIAAQGPMSLRELSEALALDVSTLNRQTAAMTKAGHLERVPDPDGGLARKFRVTPAGLEHLAADRAVNLAGLRTVLDGWPAADVEQLATLLHRFNTSIEEIDGREWPRS